MKPHQHLAFLIVCLTALFSLGCSSNPESVATKKYMTELKRSNSYAIHGWVQKQGRYTLQDALPHLTVSQVLMRAGGTCAQTDKEHVVLRRGWGGLEQRLLVSIDAIMRLGDVDETNPVVKAGDVIIVYGFGGSVEFGPDWFRFSESR